jgi:hypothetical protein
MFSIIFSSVLVYLLPMLWTIIKQLPTAIKQTFRGDPGIIYFLIMFLFVFFLVFIPLIRAIGYLVFSNPLSIYKEGIFMGRDTALFGRKFNWAYYASTNNKDVFIPNEKIGSMTIVITSAPFIPFNLFGLKISKEYRFRVFVKDGSLYEKVIYDVGGFLNKKCDELVSNDYVLHMRE